MTHIFPGLYYRDLVIHYCLNTPNRWLRKENPAAPIHLVANKLEGYPGAWEEEHLQFYELGMGTEMYYLDYRQAKHVQELRFQLRLNTAKA